MNTKENPLEKGAKVYVCYPFDNFLSFEKRKGCDKWKTAFGHGFYKSKLLEVSEVGKNGDVEMYDENTGELMVCERWDYFDNEIEADAFCDYSNKTLVDELIAEARKFGVLV